jgi:ribosomal protein L29
MKFDELKKKSPEELKKELDTASFDMMRYSAMVATGSIGKDVGKVQQLKKKIARIKTLQNEVRTNK